MGRRSIPSSAASTAFAAEWCLPAAIVLTCPLTSIAFVGSVYGLVCKTVSVADVAVAIFGLEIVVIEFVFIFLASDVHDLASLSLFLTPKIKPIMVAALKPTRISGALCSSIHAGIPFLLYEELSMLRSKTTDSSSIDFCFTSFIFILRHSR